MKLVTLHIVGVGGIDDLALTFGPSVNVICGPNGIGKTTVLDCIAGSFSGHGMPLKRNVKHANGTWVARLDTAGESTTNRFSIDTFNPASNNSAGGHFMKFSKNVIVLRANRDVPYQTLSSINRDVEVVENDFSIRASVGINSTEIKHWFVNRYLWSAHTGHLTDTQTRNLAAAKNIIGELDSNVRFARISPDTYDIFVQTQDGEIHLEYLSSGFKSCFAITLGIIKEIELRFKPGGLFVGDFDGIIVVDELDLHLHPQWQSRMLDQLRRMLPRAQIIVSTHSPHMIQATLPNEVIALGFGESGKVCRREIPTGEYGFQGWTVEEILQDVMGLDDTRSALYRSKIAEFEAALQSDDGHQARAVFRELDKMLHPGSPLRKIMRIQLAGAGENDDPPTSS